MAYTVEFDQEINGSPEIQRILDKRLALSQQAARAALRGDYTEAAELAMQLPQSLRERFGLTE